MKNCLLTNLCWRIIVQLSCLGYSHAELYKMSEDQIFIEKYLCIQHLRRQVFGFIWLLADVNS